MNNVLLIRKRLALSQKAFGDGIGVSQGNVSFYELGKQDPPPAVASKVIALAKSHGVVITFDDVYQTAEPDQPVCDAGLNKEAA